MPWEATGPTSSAGAEVRRCDIVIVGAGFSGMYMLHHLRELGFRAEAIEAAGDVGGTRYWNRHSGARCDIESLACSCSFDDAWQQEWRGRERYPVRSDILDHARAFCEQVKAKGYESFELG